MQLCGKYDGLEVVASADWLMKSKPDPGEPWFQRFLPSYPR